MRSWKSKCYSQHVERYFSSELIYAWISHPSPKEMLNPSQNKKNFFLYFKKKKGGGGKSLVGIKGKKGFLEIQTFTNNAAAVMEGQEKAHGEKPATLNMTKYI